MDLESGGVENITNHPAADTRARVNPGGTAFVFQSTRDGSFDVFWSDGDNAINLTNAPGADRFPRWSADGGHIVFQTNRDGNTEIYAMEADGSNPTNVSNSPDAESQAAPFGVLDLTQPSGDHLITGVLDAAGGQALISPGSIVSVFGDFVHITATASSIPLPENLAGFSVTFNGIPGALFGVFDGPFDQSNVQVPWNVDVSSGKVEVKVHWTDDISEVWSDPFEADAALASPGIYMFPPGTTQAIVTNFKQAGDDVIAGSWAQAPGSIDPVEGQAAAIGGVVTLWCNGLGPVTPEPATGDLPMPPGTAPVTDKIVRVFVGGMEAQVLGAVLQSQSVGLNQINIFIPEGVTPGDAVPIVIEVECPDGTKIRSREDATIAVRAAP